MVVVAAAAALAMMSLRRRRRRRRRGHSLRACLTLYALRSPYTRGPHTRIRNVGQTTSTTVAAAEDEKKKKKKNYSTGSEWRT